MPLLPVFYRTRICPSREPCATAINGLVLLRVATHYASFFECKDTLAKLGVEVVKVNSSGLIVSSKIIKS